MDFLIAGLGNPGDTYLKTRHNAGFMVIDQLASRYPVAVWSSQFQSLTLKIRIHDRTVGLIKPLTYMNRSGQAIRAVCDYFKIPPDRLVVVTDDINLPVGSIRIRPSGSAGGHNGLSDIISHLGTDGFNRIRLGVGNQFEPGRQADYVLSPFPKHEWADVQTMISQAADAIPFIIGNGVTAAMNFYNKSK